MRLQKRGQGLPLNTIILFIVVVVVLIVVVAFFLGGATGITTTIKKIFFGVTAGTDLQLAIENCKQYCAQTQSLPAPLRDSSAYCTRYEHIDRDNNGEADYTESGKDKIYRRWYCPPEVKYFGQVSSYDGDEDYLNVPCDLGKLNEEDQNGITCTYSATN